MISRIEGRFTQSAEHSETSQETQQPQHRVLVFQNGDSYEGHVLNEKPHGQGSMTYPDKTTYKGDWKDGIRHGQGIFTGPSGVKYDGQWHNGVIAGKGTYTYSNTEYYTGEFNNGIMHGKGTYVYPDGGRYVGDWKDGCENGKGTYRNPNGERYYGEWSAGLENGQGTRMYPNGTSYVGSWKNGKEHGSGAYYFPNGASCKGTWSNGFLQGPITYTYPSGPTIHLEYFRGRCSKALPEDVYHPAFIGNLAGDPTLSGALNGWQAQVLQHGIEALLKTDTSLDQTEHAWLMECKDRIEQAEEGSAQHISPKNLLTEIRHIQPGDFLVINYNSKTHAMLLQITPYKGDYVFDLFNSGDGLEWHHQTQIGSKTKYQTRKRFLIKRENLDLQLVQNLIATGEEPAERAYEVIAERASPNRNAENDNTNLRIVWQSEQKSGNCQLESWMAWMKNTAPNLHCYTRFRKALFELALSKCEQHPEMQNLRLSNPVLAKRLVDELKRKIHKREATKNTVS